MRTAQNNTQSSFAALAWAATTSQEGKFRLHNITTRQEIEFHIRL